MSCIPSKACPIFRARHALYFGRPCKLATLFGGYYCRSSLSRIFVTAVNLCAFVDPGRSVGRSVGRSLSPIRKGALVVLNIASKTPMYRCRILDISYLTCFVLHPLVSPCFLCRKLKETFNFIHIEIVLTWYQVSILFCLTGLYRIVSNYSSRFSNDIDIKH